MTSLNAALSRIQLGRAIHANGQPFWERGNEVIGEGIELLKQADPKLYKSHFHGPISNRRGGLEALISKFEAALNA